MYINIPRLTLTYCDLCLLCILFGENKNFKWGDVSQVKGNARDILYIILVLFITGV